MKGITFSWKKEVCRSGDHLYYIVVPQSWRLLIRFLNGFTESKDVGFEASCDSVQRCPNVKRKADIMQLPTIHHSLSKGIQNTISADKFSKVLQTLHIIDLRNIDFFYCWQNFIPILLCIVLCRYTSHITDFLLWPFPRSPLVVNAKCSYCMYCSV